MNTGNLFAILYDEYVRSYPLIRHALWCCTPAGADIWCNDGRAVELIERDFDHYPRSLTGSFGHGPLESLPTNAISFLIVIRWHPEMFGPQIRAARRAGVEIEVITIERVDGRVPVTLDDVRGIAPLVISGEWEERE